MRIAIGSDHAGFKLKEKIKSALLNGQHKVIDLGTYSQESCDYPEYGFKVARAVKSRKVERGILVCSSGIGMSIAANKVRGARAALCNSLKAARLSRQHNNANILVLAAKFTKSDRAIRMSRVWLREKFLGGRHSRRVKKIAQIERKNYR